MYPLVASWNIIGKTMSQVDGLEPAFLAWEAEMLLTEPPCLLWNNIGLIYYFFLLSLKKNKLSLMPAST